MLPSGVSYRVLLVSSSEQMNTSILPILTDNACEPIRVAASCAEARRRLLEDRYDIVIVNSPLPDEFGTKLALDVGADTNSGVMLLVRAEAFPETNSRLSPLGILTISKPTSTSVIVQSLLLLQATAQRLHRMEQRTANIEEKMEEIRLVNHAKWLLIERLGISEPEAHRYIEKTAMDRCVTKRAVAESVIQRYQS